MALWDPSITPHISHLALQVPKLSVHPLGFFNWSVSLHEEFLSSPQRRAQKVSRRAPGTWGCRVGYQQYLTHLECILLWSLKESFILHWWSIYLDAALIRTVEHPWGPTWLSFRSAGAELIPSKQCCICAAVLWCVLLFFPPFNEKGGVRKINNVVGREGGIHLWIMMEIKMDKQGNLWVLFPIPLNGLQLYKETEVSVNLYTAFL